MPNEKPGKPGKPGKLPNKLDTGTAVRGKAVEHPGKVMVAEVISLRPTPLAMMVKGAAEVDARSAASETEVGLMTI